MCEKLNTWKHADTHVWAKTNIFRQLVTVTCEGLSTVSHQLHGSSRTARKQERTWLTISNEWFYYNSLLFDSIIGLLYSEVKLVASDSFVLPTNHRLLLDQSISSSFDFLLQTMLLAVPTNCNQQKTPVLVGYLSITSSKLIRNKVKQVFPIAWINTRNTILSDRSSF